MSQDSSANKSPASFNHSNSQVDISYFLVSRVAYFESIDFYPFQGEFLLDEEGWKDEAAGVIKDIAAYVTSVTVSEKLPSCSSQIFLNLVTKEGNKYTIALNSEGFKVVGYSFDTADIDG